MTFDEFCAQNGIVAGEKEDFLESCAEDLELDDDVEEIPDQSEDWFKSAYESFEEDADFEI